jgi:hypothetical protein
VPQTLLHTCVCVATLCLHMPKLVSRLANPPCSWTTWTRCCPVNKSSKELHTHAIGTPSRVRWLFAF